MSNIIITYILFFSKILQKKKKLLSCSQIIIHKIIKVIKTLIIAIHIIHIRYWHKNYNVNVIRFFDYHSTQKLNKTNN